MAKKVYLKFSNGATTQLIDMYDTARQAEAIQDGFLMVMDGELPASVDSSTLVQNNDPDRSTMLQMIAAKHATANAKAAANTSLSSKSKK